MARWLGYAGAAVALVAIVALIATWPDHDTTTPAQASQGAHAAKRVR
jgi:hypothetical protein